MAARTIWGDRGDGSGTGFIVSKAGADAFTAVGDQLLIARDTFIYQPLQAGLIELPYPGGTSSANRSATVALNNIGSRIIAWVNTTVQKDLSYPPNPGGQISYDDTVTISTGGGILTITAANISPGSFFGTGPSNQVFYPDHCFATWAIFRAKF